MLRVVSLLVLLVIADGGPLRAGSLMPLGDEGLQIPPATPLNQTAPRVVDLISAQLGVEPVAARRAELVADLGRCGLATGAPALIRGMSDASAEVRAQAARAASMIDEPSLLPALIRLADDPDSRVRIEALRAGAGKGATTLVASALADADLTVFAAACALACDPAHDAAIAARLASVPPATRASAIRVLGARGARIHAGEIAKDIISEDVVLRLAVIDALTQLQMPEMFQHMRPLLQHAHPSIRRAAVEAMTLLDPAEQARMAGAMLEDSDVTVRAAAAMRLREHPSAGSVDRLFDQLGSGDALLIAAARNALVSAGRSGISRAIERAAGLLDASDPRRREDASYILGLVPSSASINRHIELLTDADPAVACQAAAALGQIGAAEAVEPLMRIAKQAVDTSDFSTMDTPRQQTIANALISLGQLGHRPAVVVARQLLPRKLDCPARIRAAAAWCVGAAGASDDPDLVNQCLTVFRDNSPFESEDVRFEAMKAIGNLGNTHALEAAREEGKRHPLAKLRWIAHVVADRLAGTTTPYEPPSAPFVAQTAIRDLSGG